MDVFEGMDRCGARSCCRDPTVVGAAVTTEGLSLVRRFKINTMSVFP